MLLCLMLLCKAGGGEAHSCTDAHSAAVAACRQKHAGARWPSVWPAVQLGAVQCCLQRLVALAVQLSCFPGTPPHVVSCRRHTGV